jgi:hypothetical protein
MSENKKMTKEEQDKILNRRLPGSAVAKRIAEINTPDTNEPSHPIQDGKPDTEPYWRCKEPYPRCPTQCPECKVEGKIPEAPTKEKEGDYPTIQEQIEAVKKATEKVSSPEAAQKFLEEAGILEATEGEVPVPDEIMQWIDGNHDGRWGFRPGAIAMYHKLKEDHIEETDCLKSEIMGHEHVYKKMKGELSAMTAQRDEANEFIRDIGKIFGEDSLGFDGISWTTEEFKEAAEKLRAERDAALKEVKEYRKVIESLQEYIALGNNFSSDSSAVDYAEEIKNKYKKEGKA